MCFLTWSEHEYLTAILLWFKRGVYTTTYFCVDMDPTEWSQGMK